jgi:hypothetical protein
MSFLVTGYIYYMRARFLKICHVIFGALLLLLIFKKIYFFNWSREPWQLKAAHQVDSSPGRALQQELK